MITSKIRNIFFIALAAAVFVVLLVVGKDQVVVGKAAPPKLVSPFSNSYALVDLGPVPQLPPAFGGLTFNYQDPNTLMIGGSASTPDAAIYAVRVRRNQYQQIVGFLGNARFVAQSPGIDKGGLDAGLTYSPKGDVMLYTSYDDNSIGQIKLGSQRPNKQTDLNTLAISPSVGGLAFVPKGFPGAGRLKITSYTDNLFYDTTMIPNQWGTYDIVPPFRSTQLTGGTDSFVYIKAGNPGFSRDSLLMTEFDTNKVAAYAINKYGGPIAKTRREFITGIGYHSPTSLTGTIGATIDPLTGDVLFSPYFENDPAKSKIIAIRGFKRP